MFIFLCLLKLYHVVILWYCDITLYIFNVSWYYNFYSVKCKAALSFYYVKDGALYKLCVTEGIRQEFRFQEHTLFLYFSGQI